MDSKRLLKTVLPYGSIASRKWLMQQGLADYTLANHLRSGKLKSLSQGIYYWTDVPIRWQKVVSSLHQFYNAEIVVGGLSALSLQGLAHYLQVNKKFSLDLYTKKSAPRWLRALFEKIDGLSISWHSVGRLWDDDMPEQVGIKKWHEDGAYEEFLLSSPERAIFEILHLVPGSLSFSYVDELFQGMTQLSPRRLKDLLKYCKSVKVMRLFFWFTDKYNYPWRNHLRVEDYNLGSGKRCIVKDGALDKKYNITVPREYVKERNDG